MGVIFRHSPSTPTFVLVQGLLNSQIDVGMFVACWTLTALASNHCLRLLHFAAVSLLQSVSSGNRLQGVQCLSSHSNGIITEQ